MTHKMTQIQSAKVPPKTDRSHIRRAGFGFSSFSVPVEFGSTPNFKSNRTISYLPRYAAFFKVTKLKPLAADDCYIKLFRFSYG